MRCFALIALLGAPTAWAETATSSAAPGSDAIEPPSAPISADSTASSTASIGPPARDASAAEITEHEPEVERGPFGAYLRVGSVIPHDAGFGAVSELGALIRVEVGAAWSFAPEWTVELGVAHGSPSASALGRFELGLAATSIQGSLVYRHPLLWGVDAHARAMISGDLGRFSANDGSAPTDLADTALGVGGAATVGLSIAVPLLRIFAEGGYQLHSGFAFGEVARDVVSGTEPARIERGTVDAGGIGLSGPVWRAGVAITF